MKIEKYCELENRVRVYSKSLEMAPFYKSLMTIFMFLLL